MDDTPQLPFPPTEVLIEPPMLEGLPPGGAVAVGLWLDHLDPATAERIARMLTDPASRTVFAEARGRAIVRLAGGRRWADHPPIADEHGIGLASWRALHSKGRASLARRTEAAKHYESETTR